MFHYVLYNVGSVILILMEIALTYWNTKSAVCPFSYVTLRVTENPINFKHR